jgi:hypothetical protein
MQKYFSAYLPVPVLSAIVAYFIWMFRDPDRLQSEDYQLARQRILHATKEDDEFPTIEQTSDHEADALSYTENDEPDEAPAKPSRLPSPTEEGA